MPLYRRVARRGFSNKRFRVEFQVVNVAALAGFEDDSVVTAQILAQRGLIKSAEAAVKLLGDGEIERRLEVQVARVSEGARRKIEGAGGSVTLLAAQQDGGPSGGGASGGTASAE